MLADDKDLFNSYFSSLLIKELNDTIETPIKHYQKAE